MHTACGQQELTTVQPTAPASARRSDTKVPVEIRPTVPETQTSCYATAPSASRSKVAVNTASPSSAASLATFAPVESAMNDEP